MVKKPVDLCLRRLIVDSNMEPNLHLMIIWVPQFTDKLPIAKWKMEQPIYHLMLGEIARIRCIPGIMCQAEDYDNKIVL